MKLLYLLLAITTSCFAVPLTKLQEKCPSHLVIKGHSEDEEILICCHGYGGDQTIAKTVHESQFLPYHLVGFNFPNYGPAVATMTPDEIAFGTFNEVAPLLTLMKECVCDLKAEKLHLYGYSAGGGAVVNAVAILSANKFPEELNKLGICGHDRQCILKAVEGGSLILDCPLKSTEELLSFRKEPELAYVNAQYAKNEMHPIKALGSFYGLKLKVFLHFEQPDSVLSNNFDQEYIDRLKEVNAQGENHITIGSEGRHAPCLPALCSCCRNRLK